MPLATTCPHCQTAYTLADDLRGRKVRCKKCGGVLVAGDAESGRHEKIQVEASRAKPTVAGRIAQPASPRRRYQDEEGETPVPSLRNNRGLMLGLIGCGFVLVLLLIGGGIVLAIVAFNRSGNAVAQAGNDGGFVPDDFGGRWPTPSHGLLPWPPERMSTVRVTRVVDDYAAEVVQDKLGTLADPGSHVCSSCRTGDRMVIVLAPVSDINALAQKIDFGEVRGVEGRLVKVIAHKMEGPPANADTVAKFLHYYKSSSTRRRADAVRHVKEARPDERRPQVAEALKTLLADPDESVRHAAIEALGVWGGKENVEALLRLSMNPIRANSPSSPWVKSRTNAPPSRSPRVWKTSLNAGKPCKHGDRHRCGTGHDPAVAAHQSGHASSSLRNPQGDWH